MQELTITPATVVLLLIIAAWAVWAVRRLFFRGLCDCHGDGRRAGKGSGGSGCAGGCSSCSARHGCAACSLSVPADVSPDRR